MRWLLVSVVVVLVVGCSSVAANETLVTASSSSTMAPVDCPNRDGGSCLGSLEPGITYMTTSFDPTITYSVPDDGWKNYEDLYGGFLLIPPDNDPTESESDYIAVYRAVIPTQPGPSSCGDVQYPLGKRPGPSPEDLVEYFRSQPELVVTAPQRATVGGLEGVVVDIEPNPEVDLTTCTDEMDGSSVAVDWVISGIAGSDFDHGVVRDETMRLYLLQDEDRVVGIEVADFDQAPASLESMTKVAESLSFAS